MLQYRQGDVLLTQIDGDIDGNAVAADGGQIVLARGEKTGHSHTMVADHVEAIDVDGTMYLKVGESTDLVHDEHGPIRVDAGTYRVDLQKEYAPDRTQPDIEPRPVPMARFD